MQIKIGIVENTFPELEEWGLFFGCSFFLTSGVPCACIQMMPAAYVITLTSAIDAKKSSVLRRLLAKQSNVLKPEKSKQCEKLRNITQHNSSYVEQYAFFDDFPRDCPCSSA